MKTILALILCAFPGLVLAQKNKEVIYEYSKYDKFDLGNLEVQGELLAPGDISVREREREQMKLDLYVRKISVDLAQKDIDSIR